MALDEPTERDSSHELDGIPFIVSKDEERYFGTALRVHFAQNRGFAISRTLPGLC